MFGSTGGPGGGGSGGQNGYYGEPYSPGMGNIKGGQFGGGGGGAGTTYGGGDGGGGAVRIMWGTGRAYPASSAYDKFTTGGSSSASAVSIGIGGFSLQRPDGKFLIVSGATTTATAVYDPAANTFSSGPALTGVASSGAHAIQRADGKFLIVHGGLLGSTSVYDPVANTMATGPSLTALSGLGSHTVQGPNGQYVIMNGGNSKITNIYDAGWVVNGSYLSEIMSNGQLDSQSILSWTGNADVFKPGVISTSVRTASTSDGMDIASWRPIKKSGDLITPAAGDTFLQVRMVMSRAIPQQPAEGRNVFRGESSTIYNRLPLTGTSSGIPAVNLAQVFAKPVITGYRISQANNANLATFSLNDSNLFRFSSNGDAYTAGGSWNAGGADVAEYFPTNDSTLEAGDIVTISPDNDDGLITKATTAYDGNLLGIITTNPGVQLGIDIEGGTAGKKPVALAGRVPLKVSLENGSIKRGDYITSSSRPGIGMRATNAGRVVAIALGGFDASKADSSGTGTVLVYVNPHMYLGIGATESDLSALLIGPFISAISYINDKLANGVFVVREFVVGKIVAIVGVFDVLYAREANIQEKMCIGQTCVDEATLREFMGLPPLPTATSTPESLAPSSTQEETPVATSTPLIVEEVTTPEAPIIIVDTPPAEVPVVEETPVVEEETTPVIVETPPAEVPQVVEETIPVVTETPPAETPAP
jgi:hypothetical protein